MEDARRREVTIGPVGLTGGSLWWAVGGPSVTGRLHTDAAMHFPIDVVRVQADGHAHWFVGALVARTRLWGHALVAMNGQFLAGRRVGVRAHPGDGLVDVYEAVLSMGDVAKVARRARLGAHLPHPGIRERRVGSWDASFASRRTLWLDGERVARIRTLRLTVEPDAVIVVV